MLRVERLPRAVLGRVVAAVIMMLSPAALPPAAAPPPEIGGIRRGPLHIAGMTLEIRAGRVVVADVAPGSEAAGAGLLPLDVVVAVNGRSVVDLGILEPGRVLALFERTDEQPIRLVVGRGGGTFAAELRPRPAGAPAPPAGADRAPQGAPAPPFTARDLHGREVSIAALRGRVILIDFWASWCAPCRATALTVRRLAADYGARLAVIGVSLDHDRKAFEAFARNRHLPGQQIFEGGWDGPIARLYGVASSGLPFAVLIDAEGRIDRATPSFDELETALARLLGPPAR